MSYLGGSVGYASNSWFGSGHDLMVSEFEPHILGFSLSLSLCPSPTHAYILSLSLSQIK